MQRTEGCSVSGLQPSVTRNYTECQPGFISPMPTKSPTLRDLTPSGVQISSAGSHGVWLQQRTHARFCSPLPCPSAATLQDTCGGSSCRPKARDQVLARMCECVCARCIAAGGGAGRHASGGAGESLACIPLGRKESSESAVPALSSFLRPSSLPSLWLKALRVLPKSVPREMPSWPRDSVTRFSSELRS